MLVTQPLLFAGAKPRRADRAPSGRRWLRGRSSAAPIRNHALAEVPAGIAEHAIHRPDELLP
jgi:hypothetical protein